MLMYLEDGVVFYDRLDSDITSKTPTYTMQGWLRMKECSPRATLLDLSVSKSVLPRLYSQCHPRVANSGKDGSMRGATGVKPVKPSQEETGKKADHVKSIRKTTDVECLEFDFIARSVQGLYHHMKSIHPQAHPINAMSVVNGSEPPMTIASMRTLYIHKKSWLVTCAILALTTSFN